MQQVKVSELELGRKIKFGSIVGVVTKLPLAEVAETLTVIDDRGSIIPINLRDLAHSQQKILLYKTLGKMKKVLFDHHQNIIKNRTFPKFSCTVGADPELFVTDSKGNLIPAFHFLPDKKVPYNNGTGVGVFWDGFQAEFNILNGGVGCLDSFRNIIKAGLTAVSYEARKSVAGAELSLATVVDISPELLSSSLDEHVAFGCEPSLNAYGLEGLTLDGREVPFRPAGGHVHLGLNNKNPERLKQLVKDLDKILGVACVALFANLDDKRRRKLYGLAGEYRTPKHGVEYRVLSNAWIGHPLLVNFIYELARAIAYCSENNIMYLWDATEEETVKCINDCDVELAKSILKRNKEMFKSLYVSRLGNSDRENIGEVIYKTFLLGVESLIPTIKSVEGNWLINGKRNVDSDRTQIRNMVGMTTFNAVLKTEV